MRTQRTCLIVDDEPDICEILQFYLETTGLFDEFNIAYDGKEAINYLENNKYDLVVLDCNLPRISGSQVVKNLGSNNIDDVIVISGDLDRDVLKIFIEEGVENFLMKPFDRMTLFNKVNELICDERNLEAL